MAMAVVSAGCRLGCGATPLQWVSRWPSALWLPAFARYTWLAQLHLGGRGNPILGRADVFLAVDLHTLIALLIVLPAAFDRGLQQLVDGFRRTLWSPPARPLGTLSYGVFLWHLWFVNQVAE